MMKEILVDVLRWVRTFVRDRFHLQNDNLPYYITISVATVLFVVALGGFIELTDELAEDELTHFDQSVSEFVISFRSETLTSWFRICTDLGDVYAYIVITILLAGWFYVNKRGWKFILQSVAVLALATASNVLLKRVINRARPDAEHLVAVNTLSYPSGHSMSAMAFYGFLIYLCVRYEVKKPLRILIVTVHALLILSIGLSRIYLGVHFPSDVAAGFVGGFIWVMFCAIIFNVFELWQMKNRSKKQNGSTPEK